MDGLEKQDSVEELEETTEQLGESVKPEEVQETEVTETQENSEDVNTQPTETITNEIEIGGEKYTLDEIKEFRQGYLRQSDYTRKTQELARQRKEMQDAVELYNYLRENPYLLQNLQSETIDSDIRNVAQQLTPEMQKIQELEMRLAQQDLDNEINTLKSKYTDFDEVRVLQEAERRGITDLEFVYKALREDDKVDVDKIKEEAVKEAKEQILAELQQNKDTTKTLIDNKDTQSTAHIIQLTPAQKRVAKNMGISEDEYAKWMQK